MRHLANNFAAIAALLLLLVCHEERPEASSESASGPALRDLAARKGLLVGAAVAIRPLLHDDTYVRTLSREFNMLTPENVMKFGPIHPRPDRFNFGNADAMVDFATSHGMKIRGHTLVWHNQLPQWLTEGSWSRDALMRILHEHIQEVVERYRGRIYAWDVVNEAVADDGSLRKTLWLDTLGPDYIDLAFQWAHDADPEALLFYNDYGCEQPGPKAEAVYELLQGLLKREVPVHGVGLQMHVSLENAPDSSEVAAVMSRFAKLGLEVHVTEMDVRIRQPVTAEKLEAQARAYTQVLKACLSQPACKALVFWGFTDRHSWVPAFFPGSASALLFDSDYHPKPAYRALVEELSRQPAHK